MAPCTPNGVELSCPEYPVTTLTQSAHARFASIILNPDKRSARLNLVMKARSCLQIIDQGIESEELFRVLLALSLVLTSRESDSLD
jgi:hypothetical protein